MVRLCAFITMVFTLIACGGDTNSPPATSTPRPPQTPVILSSPTPTVVPRLSDIDLKQALVTRADLRQVWYDSQDDLPVLRPSASCAPETPFAAFDPVASASTTFSMSDRGPWISETLLLYPDPEAATGAIDALRAGFQCQEWTQAPPQEPEPDSTATGTGDDSAPPEATGTAVEGPTEIAWSASAPSNLDLRAGGFLANLVLQREPSAEVEYVAVRENNLLVILTHWSWLDIDTDVTMSFVDLALERLDAAFE